MIVHGALVLPGLGEHVAPRWAIKGLPAAQLQLVKPISIQKHTTLLGGVRLCYLQKYDNPPQELRHSALRPVSKGYYEWLRVSPRELLRSKRANSYDERLAETDWWEVLRTVRGVLTFMPNTREYAFWYMGMAYSRLGFPLCGRIIQERGVQELSRHRDYARSAAVAAQERAEREAKEKAEREARAEKRRTQREKKARRTED